jgi:hypothetical protein
MATLTDQEYGELRRLIYRAGHGKEELKALANLPDSPTFKAILEAVETFWEDNRAALKADMDTAAGFTLTAPLAKKIGKAWLGHKMKRGG